MELTGNRNKARKLLKSGLIVSILMHVVYTVALGIYLIVMLFAGVIAAVVAAIIGASTGSGGDVESPAISIGYIIPIYILLALMVLSFIGIIFAAVALRQINNTTTKKGLIVAGVLAIISGIPSIIIPLELIGGINALKSKADEIIDSPSDGPEIIDAEVETIKEEKK